MAQDIIDRELRINIELDVTPRRWQSPPKAMASAIAAMIASQVITEVRATRRKLIAIVPMPTDDDVPSRKLCELRERLVEIGSLEIERVMQSE